MKILKRSPDKIYLSNLLWVPKALINVDAVKNYLTQQEASSRGESVRTLSMYEETATHLAVPRCFYELDSFPGTEIVDARPSSYAPLRATTTLQLDAKNPSKTVQREAFSKMLASNGGVLQLACGLGKTCIALYLIAHLGVKAVIAVDNTTLLGQWESEINKFLKIEGGFSVARGSKGGDWTKPLILTTYATLGRLAHTLDEKTRRSVGVFIGDEAHHIPADTYKYAASMFYGRRYALTATPERPDGFHVLLQHHIGPTLYRNLQQELVPKIIFMYTGMEIDKHDVAVNSQVTDYRNEIHLGKMASFFGRWRERLTFIVTKVKEAHRQGRKILVLSNSVEELAGLMSIWKGAPLFCETPESNVTKEEVGCTVEPARLPDLEYERLKKRIAVERSKLKTPGLDPRKVREKTLVIDSIQGALDAHDCWQKVQAERDRRLRIYARAQIDDRIGLLIRDIPLEERKTTVKKHEVTFAISKYGREGLDCDTLDTVFTCEAMSQKGSLQQFMGRVLRRTAWKKQPLVVFFEDGIGPMIAMCETLRRFLREWPQADGGPYTYSFFNHPYRKNEEQWL